MAFGTQELHELVEHFNIVSPNWVEEAQVRMLFQSSGDKEVRSPALKHEVGRSETNLRVLPS